MAKDVSNEDDEDDKFEKMDEESLEFLEQVKKGRARHFVLSMKGGKVRSLLLKKKTIKDKDRKAARGGGYQPVFGVATGAGEKVTFTVARSDGFDEKTAGAKTEKLKKFLKAQTGKPYKPSFELVDAPPAIPFDDEDLKNPLVARFMALESQINSACDKSPNSISLIQTSVNMIRGLLQDDETHASAEPKIGEFEQYLIDLLAGNAAVPPTPPPPPGSAVPSGRAEADMPVAGEDGAATFKSRLTELLPQIKQAVGTPHGNEAKLKASEAAIFARKQDFAQAHALLDQVETLLQGPSPKATTAPSDGSAPLAAKLAEALKKLKPLMDQVINASPNRKGELHATMARIVAEIQSQQYDQAKQHVTEFAIQLKSLRAQLAAPPAAESAERMQEFAARRDALEPRLLEAKQRDREKSAKLGAVWDYADEQARAGNFGNAFQAMDRLETAIAQTLAATPVSSAAPGFVAKHIYLRERWRKVPFEVDTKINALRPRLGTDLTAAVNETLRKLIADIDSGLQESIDTGNRDFSSAIKQIEKAEQLVNGDELIKHLDRHPVLSDVGVKSTFLAALKDLKVQLQT
ncbi:MAG: hypothetical protein WD049_01035 [Candidatus Paceibacterota bacterium]